MFLFQPLPRLHMDSSKGMMVDAKPVRMQGCLDPVELDSKVLESLVAHYQPRLTEHFEFLGVSVPCLSASWFLSAFANCMPLEAVLRLWDLMFFERSSSVIFRAALAMLDMLSQVRPGLPPAGGVAPCWADAFCRGLSGCAFVRALCWRTWRVGHTAVRGCCRCLHPAAAQVRDAVRCQRADDHRIQQIQRYAACHRLCGAGEPITDARMVSGTAC